MFSQSMLALGQKRSVIREIFTYASRRREEIGTDRVFDFSIGNPAVPPPQEVTDCIRRLLDLPDQTALHGYTAAPGDRAVREAIAADLRSRCGIRADASLIYMTSGASASLSIALKALAEPQDEGIVFAPFFPEYRVYVEQSGMKLVCVPSRAGDFQMDEAALQAALSPHTKAVIINSPNNPTGAILNEESLKILANALKRAETQFGHPIFLISDEPYRELTYDGAVTPAAAKFYGNTVVCYSFSKSLSLPGERIGYIAVSPDCTEAAALFDAVCGAGRALGFVCAPTMFQQVAAACCSLTSDLAVYDKNRRLLYDALTAFGFEAVFPDGAFYLFVKSPEPDAAAFCEKAKKRELLFVPSDDFGCPGYVRIAYCVSTDQITRSLPAFELLAKDYGLRG